MSTSATCKYTLTDSNGISNEATVTVEVTAQTTGNLYNFPFSNASYRNRPLGESLVVESDSHPLNQLWISWHNANNAGAFVNHQPPGGHQVLVEDAGDTLRTVTQSSCSGTGNVSNNAWELDRQLRLPANWPSNYDPARPCEENGRSVVNLSTYEIFQFYRMGYTSGVYRAEICRKLDVRGKAFGTFLGDRSQGTSATGTSPWSSALIAEEILTPDYPIEHGHGIQVPGRIGQLAPLLLSRKLQFPACAVDSHAFTSNHNPNADAIPYGSLFTFPLSFDLATLGLATEAGFRLATSVMRYGLWVLDASNNVTIRATGSLSAVPGGFTAFRDDYRKIVRAVRYASNPLTFSGQQAEALVGGGYNGGDLGTWVGGTTGPIGGGAARFGALNRGYVA